MQLVSFYTLLCLIVRGKGGSNKIHQEGNYQDFLKFLGHSLEGYKRVPPENFRKSEVF